jgi:hypothetical protein
MAFKLSFQVRRGRVLLQDAVKTLGSLVEQNQSYLTWTDSDLENPTQILERKYK